MNTGKKGKWNRDGMAMSGRQTDSQTGRGTNDGKRFTTYRASTGRVKPQKGACLLQMAQVVRTNEQASHRQDARVGEQGWRERWWSDRRVEETELATRVRIHSGKERKRREKAKDEGWQGLSLWLWLWCVSIYGVSVQEVLSLGPKKGELS